MRAKCCVYGCKSATYNKHGYKHLFHRFPKDLERRQVWARFCKNPTVSTKSHKNLWICSRHFEKSMYFNDLLMRSAIPTLNPPTKYDEKLDTTLDLEFISYNDMESASGPAVKSKAKHEPESGQKQMNSTSEVIETIVNEEEDDCESVTFSSEEEGLEEDPVLNNDDEKPIMDIVKDEYQPIPLTSKEPVVVGSKLSLGDNKVEPIYDSTSVYETLPDSGVSTEILPQISSVRSAASPASAINVDLDDDDCGTFAAHIKARMRNFSPGQKIIAQKLISDILFMADMKQLQMGSTVVHVHGQPAGPPNGAPAVKRQKGSFLAYLDSEDNRPSTSKMKK